MAFDGMEGVVLVTLVTQGCFDMFAMLHQNCESVHL